MLERGRTSRQDAARLTAPLQPLAPATLRLLPPSLVPRRVSSQPPFGRDDTRRSTSEGGRSRSVAGARGWSGAVSQAASWRDVRPRSSMMDNLALAWRCHRPAIRGGLGPRPAVPRAVALITTAGFWATCAALAQPSRAAVSYAHAEDACTEGTAGRGSKALRRLLLSTCGCPGKRQIRKLQVRGSNPCGGFDSALHTSMSASEHPDPRGRLPQLLAPPEHIDAAWQDVQDGEQHVHPETEDRIEEGDQDGTTGQARPQEHPAPSHSDQCVVQFRVDQVVVDRRVPVAPVEGELDREEIEAVCRDRQLLDFVVAEEGRRQREEADEEEEKVVQPDQSPIRTPDVVERDMVADPEHGNRDEAECVDEDAHDDGIAVRERLNGLTRDVRNGEAQPKDCHDRSEDAVRERFDPRLPESRDGAALRAHGFDKPSPQ